MTTPRRISFLAVTVALCAAAPASGAAYMSCDARFDYASGGFRLDRDSIKWRARPQKCRHEIDGTTAGSISLVDLTWTGWGRPTATASGFVLANHYDENGNLTRSPVRVTVSGRTRRCRSGRRAWFYSRIRVQPETGPRGQALRLYLPRKRRC
jgi:hypothetical protein